MSSLGSESFLLDAGRCFALLVSLPYLPCAYVVRPPGGQSFFSRKDSIRTIYTSLHNELKKVVTGRGALGGTAPHVEELLSHLSEQLCFFVQARVEIADFYEKMYTLSTQKFINAEELVGLLDTILRRYSSRSVEGRQQGGLECGSLWIPHGPSAFPHALRKAADEVTKEKSLLLLVHIT